jgi:hypothetical protein
MLHFFLGVAVGGAFIVFVYHYRIMTTLKTYAVDWRARAISAEQEIVNWKAMWKAKGFPDPFR